MCGGLQRGYSEHPHACTTIDKVQSPPPAVPADSHDTLSDPKGAPGPGLGSGGDSNRGSTMMSKSETFHGPGGFLTPRPSLSAHPEGHETNDKEDKQ